MQERYARLHFWPTPTASTTRPCEGNVRILRKKVLVGELSESEARAMLNGKSPMEAQGKIPAMWPTPSAGDDRGRGNLSTPAIQRRLSKGKQLNLSMVVSEKSGALNPTWVEWLMGFPQGHTDLER
jgi:DNA (cytosine-5)-methyltransferase 1